jgi:HAD superfamily hydrolase (TIGR01457 family)
MTHTLRKIRCFLLDMDGTIYLGNTLLPGARDFISLLAREGREYIFLTNNSSRDKGAYVEKLAAMGIKVRHDQVLTSGEATAIYLQGIKPGAKVFLLGTPALAREFAAHGLQLVTREQSPDYVVVGFDTTLDYQKLWDVCDLIREGTEYLATHPDINCPLEGGRYMPDAGSIIAFIEASTGRRPKVIGKPHREIVEAAFTRTRARPWEIAIVGDRLYTDIAMGIDAGLKTVLVLSGESREEDLADTPFPPDYVFKSVAELAAALGGN